MNMSLSTKEEKIIVGLIAFIVIVGVIVCAVFACKGLRQEREVQWRYVNVRIVSGDTLWALSQEYRPDWMSTSDYITLVKEHNRIGNVICPGDIIEFPVER